MRRPLLAALRTPAVPRLAGQRAANAQMPPSGNEDRLDRPRPAPRRGRWLPEITQRSRGSERSSAGHRRPVAHRLMTPQIVVGLTLATACAIPGVVERGPEAGVVAPLLALAVVGGIAAQILAVKGLQEGEAVP